MTRRMLGPAAVAIVAAVIVVSGTAKAVTPVDGGDAGGATITIDNSPGEQIDPHVSGDLAAYTDQNSGAIRYHDFATGLGHVVPRNPAGVDTLADANGSRIAISRQIGLTRQVVVYDTASAELVVIDPPTDHHPFQTAIVGDTVAFTDARPGHIASSEIQVADVSNPTAPVTNLSASPGYNTNPNIAPGGDLVVWEACDAMFSDCDVLSAVRTGAWGPAQVVAGSANYDLNPDTDGVTIVYDSDRPSATDQDIYWQPVGGGTETQLSLPGIQRNPGISAGVVSFESKNDAASYADLFVYQIASNRVFRVTSTSTVDESSSDVSVLPNGDVRLVWASNDDIGGEHNIYASTFTLPAFDVTPPAITPTVTGTQGANGWYTSDVALTWDVSEPESPASLVTTGCADQSITTDQAATTYRCSASSEGGNADPVEVTLKRDATAPTLALSGNASSYQVSQTVTIGCAARDSLSGVATDCAGIDTPAYTFPPGPNTISRTATDNAGNTGTVTATFTVVLRPAGVCTLTTQFVRSSAAYLALPRSAQWLVDATVSAACTTLLQIGPHTIPAHEAAFVNAYVGAVQALTRGGWLTATQATTLTALARGL